jgi:hypothetical protein
VNQYYPEIPTFNRRYNPGWEDEAQAQRGEFLSRFPISSLSALNLKRYAIGQNRRETFCYWAEPGTEKWARITGATADKFGVYYGRTNSDATRRYRYTIKFGKGLPRNGAEHRAFKNVRHALVNLTKSGRGRDFEAIDRNPLSPMFKAKLLSLYFPDTYLAICSRENLLRLAGELALEDESPSRIQYQALRLKRSTRKFERWSDLKYTAFVYEVVLGQRAKYRVKASPPFSQEKSHGVVDFEALMRKCRERGARSEAYALNFERMRLNGLGLTKLVGQIKDLTKKPGFGYDFKSFSSPGVPRYIEVKTLTDYGSSGPRFFISSHEVATARLPKIEPYYYFYLVMYSGAEPIGVEVWRGSDLYKVLTLEPQHYVARLSEGV